MRERPDVERGVRLLQARRGRGRWLRADGGHGVHGGVRGVVYARGAGATDYPNCPNHPNEHELPESLHAPMALLAHAQRHSFVTCGGGPFTAHGTDSGNSLSFGRFGGSAVRGPLTRILQRLNASAARTPPAPRRAFAGPHCARRACSTPRPPGRPLPADRPTSESTPHRRAIGPGRLQPARRSGWCWQTDRGRAREVEAGQRGRGARTTRWLRPALASVVSTFVRSAESGIVATTRPFPISSR